MSDQTAEEYDRARRLEWFDEAPVFVGPYAAREVSEDWPAPHRSLSRKLPRRGVRRLAGQFRPEPFPTREWARLAREAGMRYMAMTAKHHEGFCLFDSQLTDCTAAKAAAGRDLVGESRDFCE